MIVSIARKEFLDAWRDGRFRWAAIIVIVLLGVAVLLAWQQVERGTTERAAAATMERDNWLNQGKKNAHGAGHYGVYVFKPIPPLSVFDRGLEPFVGNTVFLEAHRQNQAAFLPAQDATAMRRFGELTAAAALQLLAPLLIILLTFGALAGERESGTLRQVLSLGIRPRALVLGKAIGLGVALLSLLLPVAVLGAVTLTKISDTEAAVETVWPRFIGLGAAYAAYLASILAVCLTVSALASTARSALAILLVCWAGNAVLAPRLASDFSQRLHPTPKLADFETHMHKALQDGLDGHNPRNKRLQEFKAETLRKHGVTRERDLSFNINGLVMLEAERLGNEVFDQHFGELWDLLEAQDRTVTWAGLAAPLLGLRSASMALAGTDFTHHRHFSVAAEHHRREFVRVLNEDTMNSPNAGHHGPGKGRELWEQLPPFRYEAPPAADALAAATPGLIVLCLWLVGSWTALLIVAPRLKPN
jgi:ABC-2 type transport system permease protein